MFTVTFTNDFGDAKEFTFGTATETAMFVAEVRAQGADPVVTERRYQVVDMQTKGVVGTYATRKRARTTVDRKDNEYGAYRYTVRQVDSVVGA